MPRKNCFNCYTQFAFVICLLSAYAFASIGNGQEFALEPRIQGDNRSRRLVAASLKAPLDVRANRPILAYEHELQYLEDTFSTTSPGSTASIRISAKKPALALEYLERQIDDIKCTAGKAHLSFGDLEGLQSIYRHLGDVPEFILITSHEGCNAEGERGIYLVSAVSINDSSPRIDLAITGMLWQDACSSIKVNFGSSDDSLGFRTKGELLRRQNAAPTASAAISTVAFPVPPSSQPTPAIHQAHKIIDINFQNTQILPPDFPGVDGVTLHGPFVPHGISFGCKNCTAVGSMDVLEGEFTIAQTNNSAESTTQKIFDRQGTVNGTEEIVHFFKSGFLEFRLDSFIAHIELDSAVTRSAQVQSFKIPFPQIPLTPFTIPAIATVGPIFSPNLVIGTQVASDLNFTYGFDLTIPQSTIIIDIANITNSSVSGFSGATITALPFQSQFNDIGLTLSASFSPELLLGLSVFDGDGTAGAGAFLNLPTVSATLSQVSHVNAQCEPASIAASSDTTNATADIFASLTHLTPSVNMSVGLVAEAEVHAGLFTLGDRNAYTAYQTGFPLPTACMSFDAQAKTYGPASAVVASATASAGANALPGGAKGVAANGKSNPLRAVVGRWGRVETTASILAVVLACFLGL